MEYDMSRHENACARELGKRGLTVEVKDGNIGSAIKLLKRRCLQEGMVKDLRRLDYYESPGTERRRKKGEAIRRNKKKMAEEAKNPQL
jgi:small subunit ribosomal protein S21